MEDQFKAFVDAVKDMRIAQKEYFKSRSHASLIKSKGLEREVDFRIEQFKTPDLFNN